MSQSVQARPGPAIVFLTAHFSKRGNYASLKFLRNAATNLKTNLTSFEQDILNSFETTVVIGSTDFFPDIFTFNLEPLNIFKILLLHKKASSHKPPESH